MRRLAVMYALSLVIFVLGIGGMLYVGKDLSVRSSASVSSTAPAVPPSALTPAGHAGSIWSAFEQNFSDPLASLLLQFIIIVLAARTLGSLFRRFGQPTVIGEITAGILIGPSFLGLLWPETFAFVFPGGSLGILQVFSQIGVCLFMFVVGLELDVGHLRHKAQTVVVVSYASIMVPYLLGVGLALLLFPSFGSAGTSFVTFALFMGIAISITAFPVLARILADRGIDKTSLGATAIACAAVNDAVAWAILAIVVAVARATGLTSAFIGFGLVALFVVVMVLYVRPLLARLFVSEGALTERGVIASVLIFITSAALATQVIGIHALFGAFLAGAIIPREAAFREDITVRLGNVSAALLLPLFFAFSGLRTQVGLLNDITSWLICGAITVVAMAGKFGGSMLAARLAGIGWNEAFSLGALMNTRGLVELIALNIGYDLGILSARIFSMLVLMALVTTFITGPLLDFAELARKRRNPPYAAAA
jgi:Kef-type K+ transport system membrane component KefB